jgi:hypothetical protein
MPESEAPEPKVFWLSLSAAATYLRVPESFVVEMIEAGELRGRNLRDEGEDACWVVDADSTVKVVRSWEEQERIASRPMTEAEWYGPLGDAALEVAAESVGISREEYARIVQQIDDGTFSFDEWCIRCGLKPGGERRGDS